MNNQQQVSPPVAIVTGAGVGIGLAIAQVLAQKGYRILLNDLDPTLTQQATERINGSFPASCVGLSGDASDPSFIEQLVEAAVEVFGQLDAVIANAGITIYGDFLTYKPSDFERVLRLNLGGSFFLAQAGSRQMIKQGQGGSIVLMSSVTGHQAHKNLVPYGMTKAALEMLAKGLVVEVSEFGINVNAVAPGATVTERTLEQEDFVGIWSSITPMGRPASPEDIAHAVAFLVSKEARHITGQSLVIDGGWTSVSPSPYK
ncbi:3-oxoacyl-[acyl-carrier protein] reductase [Lunatimonas lonarensis]|uniref:3-oxoacyl-[acyl-carrier protein] reductase n=1 Tax=Lunatimonas lonarensis TaxID=1232681 RepID=R7ZMH2_9BACT|nr:SDR family oxidoreductase [Lunatimonas lonarensis]EON75277.1 3-oxoacyl-[acyl-carrier protein] reductase [Lunatimonas lonarensis]